MLKQKALLAHVKVKKDFCSHIMLKQKALLAHVKAKKDFCTHISGPGITYMPLHLLRYCFNAAIFMQRFRLVLGQLGQCLYVQVIK